MLVDFGFNVGTGIGGLKDSTLLKVIKRGGSDEEVKEQLDRWVWNQGVKSGGLWRRRQDEYQIWKEGDYKRDYPDIPAGYN